MPDKKPTVVFDLDETLVICFSEFYSIHDEIDKEVVLKKYPWMNDFYRFGFVFDALAPHLLLPGVLELLRWLDSQDIQFAFYSAGSEARNHLLVPQLLRRALGATRYCEIKNRTHIWSFEDLSKENKKELKAEFLDLENTIFVEDNLTYVAKNQGQLVLNIAPAIINDFKIAEELNRLDSKSLYYLDENTFMGLNHIFYMAGILSTVISQAKEKNSSWVQALVDVLQTQKQPDNRTLFQNHFRYNTKLMKELTFYEIGLQVLQNIKPELDFYAGSRSIKDYCSSKPQSTIGNFCLHGVMSKTQQVERTTEVENTFGFDL